MKKGTFPYQEGLLKGLRAGKNPRNNPTMLEMVGVFLDDGVLRDLDLPSQLDTSTVGGTYPFPQLFELSSFTLICTATAIYQYENPTPTITLLLSGITAGSLWSFADFGPYVVGTNAAEIVERDAETGVWSIYDGCDIPLCSCMCNFNGQLIVGDPEKIYLVGS